MARVGVASGMPEANDALATGRLSTSVGDYLKAILLLSGSGPATTGDIARELGVTAPSVTSMLTKLARDAMILYEPYRGATLTPAGLSETLRLVRRHRLLETFLIRELGYGWEEVHEEAERMEHVMSERFTERLAQLLGQPAFDPHGDPIPRPDGSLPQAPSDVLAAVEAGARFEIHRVRSQEPETLGHLTELRLIPGARVKVIGRDALGHLLRLQVEGGRRGRAVAAVDEIVISRELAALLLGSNLG